MLTNTIAEIRTYGEGFIIVDQSPSSVDIAAIKNTNTKIVLRTPEANDRYAVGRSIGLTEDQVNEIAKLPSGVAVVYQNDWLSPVLTMVDKANVTESNYIAENKTIIKPLKTARTEILKMLLHPWLNASRISKTELLLDAETIDISREMRKQIVEKIEDYDLFEGQLVWAVEDIPKLQKVLKSVLALSENELTNIKTENKPDKLRELVKSKTKYFSYDEIEEICSLIYKEETV
jgi:type IV secretory pathway VirB4 component